MSLEPIQQFKNFLEKSKDVLILIPENPTGDAVGASWALYFFLEKKGIRPTIAFSNNLSPKYAFLPRPQNILTQLSGARDFVLSFNTEHNRITGFRSEEQGNNFNIYITPEKGVIDPKDFSFILAKFKYDLIVVLDCSDLDKLGKLHAQNPDLFFEVPVVNVDHRTDNENFGQINLVDVIASSCSEILAAALESIDYQAVDKTIADCLLTGIISATDSFQKKNTTPRALLTAATLMDKGADQQEIVRWLYKTQPLPILKLWGRAMAKLNWDEQTQFVWANLSVEDFVQSRSEPKDVFEILEKLQENYSDGRLFMLLYGDTLSSAVAKLKAAEPELLLKLQMALGGELKGRVLEIKLPSGDLESAGHELAKKIKEMNL